LWIVHQDKLETILVQACQDAQTEVVGNDYFLLGTVDKATWRKREKLTL